MADSPNSDLISKVPFAPFYDRDGIVIYNATWQDVLPSIAGVNCVVTSPPYNQRLETFKPSGMTARDNSAWASRMANAYFDSKPEHVYQAEQVQLLAYLYECAADNGSVFYNHKLRWRDGELIDPRRWIEFSEWRLRQDIIWRRDGSLTLNAKMFPPCDERIYWLDKGRHKWNQEAVKFLNVWDINSEKKSMHAVAFPVEIPQRCILATCDAGDLVIDPCMGSGTTLVAARRLGMRAIGVEVEQRYCEMAVERLRQNVMEF